METIYILSNGGEVIMASSRIAPLYREVQLNWNQTAPWMIQPTQGCEISSQRCEVTCRVVTFSLFIKEYPIIK